MYPLDVQPALAEPPAPPFNDQANTRPKPHLRLHIRPFNSETARLANAKRWEKHRKNQDNARAITEALRKTSPKPVPLDAARLEYLRRQQRVIMNRMNGVTNAAEMLAMAKSVRELFEIEMELLGRRPVIEPRRGKRSVEVQKSAELTLPSE